MASTTNPTFSNFCADLDCKLVHYRKSWSAYNEKLKRGLFTIWDDRLDKIGMRYEFGEAESSDMRFGAKELRKNIEAVTRDGGEAFGIQSIARSLNTKVRNRKYFDREKLLYLRFTLEKGTHVAYVLGEVKSEDLIAGKTIKVASYPDAINDLDVEPNGQEFPGRTSSTNSGYCRDPKIRAAVLRRAKGKCEHCDELGFSLKSLKHYVEAHHIIHLSMDGPDTMENVIALCPNHHREAHYGSKSDVLERELMKKLKALRRKK
jgi:5-methylcytosine-specific restriction enzyme A